MAMTIQELREKRAKAWDTARDFLDSKRNASGVLSAEDSATYDQLEQTVVDLGKEIQRLERQQSIEAEMSKPTSSPILGTPTSTQADIKIGTASDVYKKAFWDNFRGRGYGSIRDDLRIGENSEGGYLCPDEYEKKLIEALQEENIFRRLATIIHTSSGDRKIPVVTSKGDAVWMDENEQFTLSDDTFGQTSIGAYKLGTAIKVSEELLNDSVFDLPSYIAKEFARRIGAKEEEAFFVGDGIGKPTGIFNATGGAETGVTVATANITFDDIMDLFYSLRAPYRNNATWILNDSTVKAIRKLKDNNGNYLWQEALTAGTPGTLLGRPVFTSAYMPTIAAGKKVIAFGDFNYYWIADRQGRSFKRLNELYAATGQVGFIANQRVDGKLILPEAIKVLAMKSGTSAS